MLKPVLIEPPALKPVSLSEAKHHLGIYDTDEFDTLLTIYIDAATDYLDGYSGILGMALMEQTWRQDYDRFPTDRRLKLPKIEPVISVVAVSYFDSTNTKQTLDSENFQLLSSDLGPYLVLKEGYSWPDTYARDDAVSVTIKAGHEDEESIPATVKAILLLYIAHWFAHREAVVMERGITPTVLPLGVDALAAKIKPPVY